jgi:hypothetical protein
MEPVYMNENRYSYLVGSPYRRGNASYVVESPETEFELHVQQLVTSGQTHLQHEEFTLALQAFQDAMSLILHTVHPTMPIDRDWTVGLSFPRDLALLDTLVAKSTDILQKTPAIRYSLPTALLSQTSLLSQEAQKSLAPVTSSALQITSFHESTSVIVTSALEAASQGNWDLAIKGYETALASVPQAELSIVGGLQHDLAVLNEKANKRDRAQELAQASIRIFETAKATDAQAEALATTAGIFARSGKMDQAAAFSKSLEQLRSANNFNPVTTAKLPSQALIGNQTIRAGTSVIERPVGLNRPAFNSISAVTTRALDTRAFSFNQSAPELMGLQFLAAAKSQKILTVNGMSSAAQITLDGNANSSAKTFLSTIAATKDLGLLVYWQTPIEFVAYIPHIYFFVIPMCIADCHKGMGNLAIAQQQYVSVLTYPFINTNYEIVKLWTRLAETLLDRGDEAYRAAKDNVTAFTTAKAFYEAIVLTNKAIPAGSVLYADAKFAGIKTRVAGFLGLADPLASTENPAITAIVLNALTKLHQIQAEFNFFGFAPDYIPPFSFEYLQNTARYFAQHASQTEQRFIQYKSQAENEEFRREQLNQQAEVARQSVVLEERGIAEASRGIDVANASRAYAQTQTRNAEGARTDFNNVSGELAELAELEAWANAASVSGDDQMKLNISSEQGFQYFEADGERRDHVIQKLARQRTRISHDLEKGRLDRAVISAQSYEGIATAQVAQAQARLAVAQQRVVVAQLQQRYAEENRDFLDMREFGARLWYELAQQAKRITQRYLDMATEIAFLMERAYNAETERGLRVIRYDYQRTQSGNLMGADMLMGDIDYFTFDHITTTKNKKIPVKKTISLADAYPTQFRGLKATGVCMFETLLADFDRAHPGFYLAKIRNVELILVGVTGATSIAGTLRNVGLSRFRSADGSIKTRHYPADVMALSQYEIRQDALAFRFNPNDLRLFENNGIDTLWQLHLPLGANDFDFEQILDVQLLIYYDGFFDSALENTIKLALPTTGNASRGFSMRLTFPDELFFLKNQGEAELTIDASLFPANQRDPKRVSTIMRLSGEPATINNLKIRISTSQLGSELLLAADANGEINDSIPGVGLALLRGKSLQDQWKIRITDADNPGLVQNGKLNLSGLRDVLTLSDYTFTYR